MLQQPAPSLTTPAIARDLSTGSVVINPLGNTRIVLRPMSGENPDHHYWNITIKKGNAILVTITSLGQLPRAMLNGILVCVNMDLILPPRNVRKMWCSRKLWHSRNESGRNVVQIGCRCGMVCTRHAPLLTMSTLRDGRTWATCCGNAVLAHNDLALATFVAERLLAHRYLR